MLEDSQPFGVIAPSKPAPARSMAGLIVYKVAIGTLTLTEEWRSSDQRYDPSPQDPANPNPHTPASRQYHENGQLLSEKWRKDGWLHNPNPEKPALREWYPNGELASDGRTTGDDNYYEDELEVRLFEKTAK